VAPLETTVTPNSKDVREGGQEASPKRESGHFTPVAYGPDRDQTTPMCDICSREAESGARRPALLCQPISTHNKTQNRPRKFSGRVLGVPGRS
jgi:hypothetical protein